MKQIIFTLTSARSGTLYLRYLFRNNIPDCCCRHEPFFDRGNPTMLGPAIYDAYAGRRERIRGLLSKKLQYVNRLRCSVYLETSHAFLKSAYLAALEYFPHLKLIHLIRDPLKVAQSEAWREAWRRRLHAPFHFYRGDDGGRYFFWSLTGKEEIFQTVKRPHLTLFQRCLIQWIEVENRAVSFLSTHQLHDRCFTLHAPGDLNDATVVKSMFDFFGLPTFHIEVVLGGRKNKSLGMTNFITEADEREAEEVLEHLPERYLEIFGREPYRNQKWNVRFRRLAGMDESLSVIPKGVPAS